MTQEDIELGPIREIEERPSIVIGDRENGGGNKQKGSAGG